MACPFFLPFFYIVAVVLLNPYGLLAQVRSAITNKYGPTKGQIMSLKRTYKDHENGKLRKQDVHDQATVYCAYALRGAATSAKRARRLRIYGSLGTGAYF